MLNTAAAAAAAETVFCCAAESTSVYQRPATATAAETTECSD